MFLASFLLFMVFTLPFESTSDQHYTEANYRHYLTKIATRQELIKFVPNGGEALELGVRTGVFSEQMLKLEHFGHLTSIDAWQDTKKNHYIKEYGITIERLRPYRTNNTIIRMFFDEAAIYFADEIFDFIYVDGYAHAGANRGRDFITWWPKLKKGGLFAGHDYGGQYKLIKKYVDKFYEKKIESGEAVGKLLVTLKGDKLDGEKSWYFRKAT